MRTWLVVAPAQRAESVRRELRELGLLRTDMRAIRTAEEVGFPVHAPPEAPLAGVRIEERDLAPEPSTPRSYRDLLQLPPAEQMLLPRSFDVIGDVVLIRLPPELRPRGAEIGAALRAFVPGARRVGSDEGVHGEARLRRLVPLAGSGSWRTLHREHGLELLVDPEVAYFSPRLAREHELVAAQVRPEETVWDLCCGIGPFALTIAHRGVVRRLVAVDSNPAAIALLRENAQRLGLADRIEIRGEPVERFLPGAGLADRVVLNLPHEGIKYVPSVAAAVAPGGTLHYYEVTPRVDRSMRGNALLELLSSGGSWECVDARRVHPYSPQADLVSYTLCRR
jgi:tRNA (guanine37-N1)-methyltransferase